MKKNLQLILVLVMICQSLLFAQNARITGKVTDQANEPLPGVNILVGGTNKGTTTDADGKYAIEAPSDASLVFSYIGYTNQTIKVNARSIIDLKMTQEEKSLNEVVVTALGIKREIKTLGYATATVNADEISTNRSPNVVSGL